MFSLLAAATPADDCAVVWNKTEVLVPSATSGHEQTSLPVSVWDELAAPTVFLQQVLVLKGHLDTAALRHATQLVINSNPIFAARAVTAVVSVQILYMYELLPT